MHERTRSAPNCPGGPEATFEELTAGLQREHRRVLSELDALDAAARGNDGATVWRVVGFFEKDVALHRRKEEHLLFPALAGFPQIACGPLPCLRAEHAAEALLVQELRAAVEQANVQPQAWDWVRLAAEMLSGHVRMHIRKEDRILFPMADHLLSPAQVAALREGMDAMGYLPDAIEAT